MLARRGVRYVAPRRAPCAYARRFRATAASAQRQQDHAYAKTLLLPSTTFSEHQSQTDENNMLKYCNDTLYKWNEQVI